MSSPFDSITFYSHFGNGDIFNSRVIIQEIMKKYPQFDYYYAHSKDPEILADIPNLKSAKVESFMKETSQIQIGQERDLYINTWIGQGGKYLRNGLGIHLDQYLKMFNDNLKRAGLESLSDNTMDYIPFVNFSNLNQTYLNNVTDFMDSSIGTPKILISNGDVWSDQAKNFSFKEIIDRLTDFFPKCFFIITEEVGFQTDNLFYTQDIIKKRGCDLLEISWLSIFCRMVIGRSSGPYVFTQIKENYLSEDFKFLSFTYHPNTSDLCYPIQNLPCTRKWSSDTNTNAVYSRCRDEIEWIL